MQILRHRQTTQIPDDHHQKGGGHNDTQHLAGAGAPLVHTHLRRMVHDRLASRGHSAVSGQLPIRGEPCVRCRLQFYLILDTVHHHAVHVPRDIPRSESPGEAAGVAPGHRHAHAQALKRRGWGRRWHQR